MVVHGQDTTVPPATVFLTTPPRFRISPPESVGKKQTCQGQSHRPLSLSFYIVSFCPLLISDPLHRLVIPSHHHLLTLRTSSHTSSSGCFILFSSSIPDLPSTHASSLSPLLLRTEEGKLSNEMSWRNHPPVGISSIGKDVLSSPHHRLIGPSGSPPVNAIHYGHYTDVLMQK